MCDSNPVKIDSNPVKIKTHTKHIPGFSTQTSYLGFRALVVLRDGKGGCMYYYYYYMNHHVSAPPPPPLTIPITIEISDTHAVQPARPPATATPERKYPPVAAPA